MSWKTMLVLLLLCAGLGLYLLSENLFVQPEATDEKKNFLLPFELEEVLGMKVVDSDTSYVIRRQGNDWMIVEPTSGLHADTLVINHVLRVLRKIIVVQRIPLDSINLVQVNLDKPVLDFTLQFARGDSGRVRFGALNPATENIYVRRNEEDQVLLIPRDYGPMLMIDGFMIKSKGLYSGNPYRVRRIRYSAPGMKDVVAEREHDTGDWWLRQPGGDILADKRMIVDMLHFLRSGFVRQFHSSTAAPETETGLKTPFRKLQIEGVDQEEVIVTIGNIEKESGFMRWASSSIYTGQLLLIDSSMVSFLDYFKAENLRNLQIAMFDPGLVDRIELISPIGPLVITAESDTLWQIVEPGRSGCMLWQIERLLMHADTMGANRILPQAQGRGFDHPQLTVIFSGRGKVLANVVVGDYVGESEIYMRDQLRDLDFIAPASQITRLSYTFKDLADIPVKHVVR